MVKVLYLERTKLLMNEPIRSFCSSLFKPIIALLLVFVGVFFVRAEVQFFDYSNGLSNEKISSMCKDRAGVMWIGTDGGLNQFNGYEFVEIGYFKEHAIKAMYYDSLENMLWVGSNKGLFLFNVETHVVLNATAQLQHPAVVGIGRLGHDMAVAFRNGEVMRFFQSGSVRVIFSLAKSTFKSKENILNGMAFDGRGYVYLFIHHDDGLVVSLDADKGTYHAIEGLSSFTIWNITSGNGRCIMNADNDKIISYSEGEGARITIMEVPDKQEDAPTRIIQEINGTLFISYREGYGSYELVNGKRVWHKWKKTEVNRMLKSKIIRVFFLDDNNVVWIGTTKGIIKSTTEPVYPFKRLLDTGEKKASVRQMVAGARDQLFIATYDGIFDCSIKTGEAKLLAKAPKEAGFPNYARTLYYAKGEYLYAGSESNSNYFYRYNFKTQQYEGRFFKEATHGPKITAVYSMITDATGLMWLATDVGLASFNPVNNKIELHTTDKFSVGNRRLMYIQHALTPGKFWVCGKGGAFGVDINKGVEHRYDFSSLLGLADFECLFVSEDAKHNMWFASQKYGVVTIPQVTGEPQLINASIGLASNEVYAILWENDSVAWITTSNGLSRYNVNDQSFDNYLYENGIADDEFNQHSFFRASDTLFFLGGINGVTYFNPHAIGVPQNKMSIFLANITRWGTEDKEKQISFRMDDIVMNPTDYLITLTLGLSDYSNPSGNSYYYKINNLNSNWISLGAENSLTLNGLAPGEYQIRVKGINSVGVQSENMLGFSLTVKEHFYKTGWFYVILVFLFISLLIAYFRWRLNRITQRQLLRTQISSNLHDEVGSLLTQIVISTDNALYATQDLEEKNKRLSKISTLSRNAINTMSDVLWSIDSRNDFVGNLTDRMREHAELMTSEKGIELNFEFSNTRVLKGIDPQVRQQLYLIYKETIHNIIKHSKATIIKVKFKTEGKGFMLCVSNNCHNDVAASGKLPGQGINNIHMRAKKIKATCAISSHDGWFVVLIEKSR